MHIEDVVEIVKVEIENLKSKATPKLAAGNDKKVAAATFGDSMEPLGP